MSEGEKPPTWGKRLVTKAGQWMEQAHQALIKNDPVIRDPHIDVEHNSVRVFFPRTEKKVQFRLALDPVLGADESRRMWDEFLAQPERTPEAMKKYKVFCISFAPEKQDDFQGSSDVIDPENERPDKRKLTGRIIRNEYGVTYDEYADAWYLARRTLLNQLKPR